MRGHLVRYFRDRKALADAFQEMLADNKEERLPTRVRTYAGKVCKDVWGIEYEPEKFNCDEYPFASTREGAYTSTDEGRQVWHGSARPIEGGDNQLSGTWMNTDFYKVHRVLDGDPFVVKLDL